ncbi:nucleoside triphosphate pyrophosphohydrolase [Escherichia coli]|uniref:Nucleoside triphosphate pyrophosphohydrolase n=1 Tax=Escherichia coli TaxID=562 RepID=A0A376KQ02_ECOLX|nr:nucleoside triphosphate pyrophosphohydrolase [Escherichia coli]
MGSVTNSTSILVTGFHLTDPQFSGQFNESKSTVCSLLCSACAIRKTAARGIKSRTFATIAPYTLEETYEVLDAIAREDFDDLRGELGDLLFQVVFYAQMAQEEGRFDFNDICAAISDKLERRHPHVFADSSAENSSEVLARWEQIKTEERAQKAQHSALDDIPRSLPALMRAQKIQKRCANVGFDWTTLGPVVDKVYEEIDEVMYEARQAVVDQAKLGGGNGGPAVCHG